MGGVEVCPPYREEGVSGMKQILWKFICVLGLGVSFGLTVLYATTFLFPWPIVEKIASQPVELRAVGLVTHFVSATLFWFLWRKS